MGRQFLSKTYFFHEFENGSSVLVSEFVEGQLLENKSLTYARAKAFCESVAFTLKRFGLTCEDIHGANIIIPKNGVGFKVIDYAE